ncbi:MAG: ABC transporter substrate-binding protein [Candidatus Methanomethylicaceae archaeon]
MKKGRPGPCLLALISFCGLFSFFVTPAQAKEPIRIGFVSIFSGRVAMLGEEGSKGVFLAAEEINSKGGLLGRKIEVITRDSGGKIEEAVRIAREFVVREKVDFLLDGSSSRESFAVKEVSRDLKKLTMVTASETTSHTADPTIYTPYTFRTARVAIHDAIVGGYFAAKVCKEKNLRKWYSISPDYEYGHDNTELFFRYTRRYYPDMEVVGQVWPKLFEPDYTAHITKILKDKPDAVYSALWAGDLASFLEQASLYGLFEKLKFFGINIADPLVITALKKGVPAGMYTGNRYNPVVPDTQENKSFAERYKARFGTYPSNWSWQAYTAILALEEAVKRCGTTDNEKVIKELEDLEIPAPCAQPPRKSVVMRGRDHQLIYYTIGWAETISQPPYVKNVSYMSWEEILKLEEEYYKEKGWLK